MELQKTSKRFDKFLQKIKELGEEEVEIGWFAEQGLHYSGLTYPDLARTHFNGVQVPRRDILGVALFLYDPKNDPNLKRAIRRWMKTADKGDVTELFKTIGRIERNNIQKTFGNPKLGVTDNPTPLVDTGSWKDATVFKLRSEGRLRKR